MAFSERQTRALGRSIPTAAIRTRMISGKELSFIEGWYALDRANRIFGFDGWDRETVETKCLQAREARGVFAAVYLAKVRVTVRFPGGSVVREGHGTGEAQGDSIGEVHDRALKAAETDATKRALVTFGKAFGLALHAGKGGRAVSSKEQPLDVTTDRFDRSEPSRSHDQVAPAHGDTPDTHRAQEKASTPSRRPPSDSPRIDKSVLALPEINRIRDKEHLRYVASQPCLLCSATPSDAHHIRFAQPRAMGRKVGDDFTVPLCRNHHRALHQSGNESAWWHAMGVEPLEIARDLWEESHYTRSAAE